VTTAAATARERRQPGGAFAALTSRGFRIYLGGQSLANTGSWMQRIAQDWLIFSLTRSSTAVGVTIAMQFLPMLLLGLHAGAVADRLPKKRILLTTQLLNAAATMALAAITISGAVRPAEVYAFALVAGVIFAFDAPARQAFVTEVVPPDRLHAAISLNAAVFQATRLIGPAIASGLIVSVGTGWVFALNAVCYLGPTAGLLMLRPTDFCISRGVHTNPPDSPPAQPPAVASGYADGTPPASLPGSGAARPIARSRARWRSLRLAAPQPAPAGGIRAAARYVRGRPDVLWTIFLVGMLGTFGLNFPIVLTAMATAFHGTASTYGLFNIILAVGSAVGALLAGAASRPRPRVIVAAAAGFGLLQAAAAVMPGMPAFLPTIAAMGFVNLMFQAMANAYVQLAVGPELRGRVMGLYMLAFIGGAPIGAPTVGAVTSHFGARAGMATCGVITVVAAVITAVAMARRRRGLTVAGNIEPLPLLDLLVRL
jgi:MFS family permease